MKIRKLFIIPISISLLLFTSCNQEPEKTYSYQLMLEASSNYLDDTRYSDINYSFLIDKGTIIQEGYHDLKAILCETSTFLKPVAIEYITVDGKTTKNKELSYEETIEKLNPTIEFSDQFFGGDNFDINLYSTPQQRKLKVTSNVANVKESELYNIQISINDDIPPEFDNNEYSFESEVGYDGSWDFSSSAQDAKKEIREYILSKVNDNNLESEITLHYFMDENCNQELSFDEMIKSVRANPNLIKNNKIQPITIYIKAEDNNNNFSDVIKFNLTLRDNVAPYLCDENFEEIKDPNPTLGFNEERQYYPDIYDDLEKAFRSYNYKAYDEVEGEIKLIEGNYSLHISTNGTVLNIYPKNGTSASISDRISKMVGNMHTSFVYYPEGSSVSKNPERGVKYLFINTNEISLTTPNIEDVSEWKGTDGKGNVILPTEITLYGHTYKVTKVSSLLESYIN